MNSLFNHGIKQIQTLKKDLETLESSTSAPLSVQGQVAASLSGLSRTIQEIQDLIGKETNKESKNKVEKKLSKFRNELSDLKTRFEVIKKAKEEATLQQNKSELLNRSRHYNNNINGGSGSTSTDNPFGSSLAGSGMTYEQGMYKERDSLGRSSAQLDEILEMGQRSFDDLVTQNQYLVKFEKSLTSGLTTLGVSRRTIQKVERRAYEDRFIFFGGAIFMFFCFYLILKYLR